MKDNAHTERIDNADSVQAAAEGSDDGPADDGGAASTMAMIDKAAAQAETAMRHLGALIEDRFADVDVDVERLAQSAPQDWHAQAKLHLQMGFMLARRSVEMPTHF